MYNILILAGALASATAFLDDISTFSTSNCTDNEFFCGNLECVPLSKQCDGISDCNDASDELDCEMFHCQEPDFFRCKNQRCINSAFVCDSENDCGDFSDENNCEEFKKSLQRNSTCREDQWRCADKLCIPQEWVCNGESDCPDSSDEVQGCSTTIKCDGFKCKNGHCIVNEWRCDGQDDCMDNSDEEGCGAQIDPKECTMELGHFLCSDSKSCLKLSEVCDGTAQCPDKSDEGARCKETCESCAHDCVQLPTGPKCVCPKGYRTIDQKHCEDINECEVYGICDQRCRNVPGSYQCYCDENYSLQNDKKSCKAHFGEATLFFSTQDEIRALLLRSEIYFSVASNLKLVVGVDFDGEHVYWTIMFSEHECIVRSLKDGREKEVLVTSGLLSPEDLRIDHITKNIYFTDTGNQHIGVCSNDGSHCAVLVDKDVHKPRGIVLHPIEGEMYWTDWGHHPEIARALMDGSNETSFVTTDIHWPNGLAIDYPNDRLYWTDAKLKTLESIRLDGTDRRIILEGIVKHPYSIAVFEGRLYWSDWSTNSIQSCDKFTGKNHHTLITEDEHIFGLSIYHPNNHKKRQINGCARSMCSHLCLLKGPSAYACACPQDKKLGPDGHTCKDTDKQQKLMIGVENMLIEVAHKMLGKHGMEEMMVGVKNIGALAYNSGKNILYISDLEMKKIIGFNLHTRFSKTINVGEIGQVTAMDYDYLGDNLYWCDSERKTVEVFNLNTHSRTILLHDMHEETPESIALVPEEGVMFVAFRTFHRHHAHVDRFLMDGTTRTHSIESDLSGPVVLLYDYELHRVFIADGEKGKIESTSVDGDDRHGFRSLGGSPIAMASLKSDVFFIMKNTKKLYWSNKYNNDYRDFNKNIALDYSQNTDKMHLVSITSRRIGLSPCQNRNGGCSHLCLHSLKRVVCACPIGMKLDKDSKTCIKRVDCDEFFCSESNVCVPKKFRCDGVKNCPKGEDEDDCKKPNHCSLDHFQCQDGECVRELLRCDGNFDCRDKSDEHNCSHVEKPKCPANHFRCKSGQCINGRFVCDGVSDCPDAEDETNCLSTVCKDTEFRCLSGACIPKYFECDHEFDCPDNSDEHSDCATCDPLTFTCTNGKCVDRSFLCDGENDCGDNSDESSCKKIEEACDPDEFACTLHTEVCLPHAARCNGSSECPHHEDEQDCSNCQVDEFSCKNGKCVPTQWTCDRSDDCGDSSDEDASMCGETVPSEHQPGEPCNDRFRCKSGKCIDYSLVCNGEPNCFDGSDEEGVCNTSCTTANNICSQICLKTPTGPTCRCQEGFHLKGDGRSCEDINECEEFPPVCSQLCRNFDGNYLCDCYEGFVLRTDRISCKAEGKAMSLLFTSDNQIRRLSQIENSLKLVYSEDTPRITGLDVSVKTGAIIFTAENTGTILMLNSSNKVYLEDVGQPGKLVLDWMTNNIYYVNNEPNAKSISICNFDDKACSHLIPVDQHRQISAIAVDATNKLLFYSLVSWWMFNSPNYVIYKTNLDGTESQEIVKSSSGYVTGLSCDIYKKQLYFVDQHQGQLTQIRYDGSKKTVLASNLTRPTGLSFFENLVYFLTPGYMGKCRLYEPAICDYFRLGTTSSDLFAIFQESKQPQLSDNPCENHTCSHLCVPAKMNYKCLCDDGRLLTTDEECDSTAREAGSGDRKRLLAIHREVVSEINSGAVIAGVMISICLLTFGVVIYYLAKRRNSGTFNVISMRFQNPGYGLHIDDPEKSILQPGEHEYSNPIEFHNDEEEIHKREAMLVNV